MIVIVFAINNEPKLFIKAFDSFFTVNHDLMIFTIDTKEEYEVVRES